MQGTEPRAGKASGASGLQQEGMDLNPRHGHRIKNYAHWTPAAQGRTTAWCGLPGASVHVFYDHPDSTSVSCPDHLISAARRKEWFTSNRPAAGAPARRAFPPANESEPCTGWATGPLKPEHLKHALPDGYHTRCPHQLETDGPQC